MSVPPGDPTGARNGIFPPASSSPPCSRTVPWSRHLFSPTNIPLLDGNGSFIAEKRLDIHVRTSHVYDFAPPEQYNWGRNQSTLLVQQRHPSPSPAASQPVNPSSPLSDDLPNHNPNPYQPSMATLSTQDQISSLNPNLNQSTSVNINLFYQTILKTLFLDFVQIMTVCIINLSS